MEFLKYIILLILVIIFSILLSIRIGEIKEEKNNITKLEQVFFPILKLQRKDFTASYISNNSSTELYYQTQFVFSPIIIENNTDNDTILYLLDKQIDNKIDSHFFVGKIVLKKYKSDFFEAYLLKKKS